MLSKYFNGKSFYFFQQLSLILILANLFFSGFYLFEANNISWSAVFLFPAVAVLIFVLSSFMIVRPHFYSFPKGLVLAFLHEDYLEVLYQIIRKQILVIGFLLQLLLAYTNWGNLNQAFVDPTSFATYIFWILIATVVVATAYYLYLLSKKAFELGLTGK